MAVVKIIRKINDIAAICLMSVLAICVIAQVICRYALGAPLTWSEELARYMQIWMVMLGSAVMMRKGGHLAIDLVTASLPPKVKRVTDFLVYISIIVFFSIVVWQGVPVSINALKQHSPAMQINMGYVYMALPVGGALVLMETVIRFVRFIKTGSPDEPGTKKTESAE